MKYVIGTRGSKLALAQASYVCDRLKEAYPENDYEIRIIRTKGDAVQDRPLDQIGDKGVFVKEIEEQILAGKVDMGVHSMKDMPAQPAPGLAFVHAWKREDPRDVLILREKKALRELPYGAVIGTGSRRRELQLKRLRPDLKVVGIRGNVDTRLRKMEELKLDGLVLAAAGLHRLGMAERITEYLEPDQMIPAPAQGVLALEIREGDEVTSRMLNALSHGETEAAVEAERGFLQRIGGDCHIPIGAVCSRMPDGRLMLRAVFGKKDSDRLAFSQVCGRDPGQLAEEAAEKIRRELAGKVYLVGGGPGDPGLITVKGLKAIRSADCIVYDRLSSPALLEEAKEGCERIYVGKANRFHTMKQEEINALLIQKSLEYETVVRLKGGDAYVFGRGGEEGLALAEQGIAFEVIPGISSCTAGPAYAGIPITHRGIATGFHVVTAHDRRDKLAEIDFVTMARGKETCIFLMGLEKLDEITRGLLDAGMEPETPAAVISKATTPKQRTVSAPLVRLEEETRRAGLESPALIVVGDVVAFREKLNFYETKPLAGRRYLIPGIGRRAMELAELLQEQGAAADVLPVGDIEYKRVELPIERLQETDWLIFTSQNGVEGFLRNLASSGLDLRSLAGCRIASIGGRSAECLRSHGLFADLIPEKWNSDALADALADVLSKTQRVLYLKAENADCHLKERLGGVCSFEELAVYANRAVNPDGMEDRKVDDYDGILCTSASAASRLLNACVNREEWIRKGCFYSIGPKTTACLKGLGVERIQEAGEASYETLAWLCMGREEKS